MNPLDQGKSQKKKVTVLVKCFPLPMATGFRHSLL